MFRSSCSRLISLFLVAHLACFAYAQRHHPGAKGKEDWARGLHLPQDTLRILVLKNEKGQLIPVDPSNTFKQGDEIKISFESSFDGYVYIVNVTPERKMSVLFPDAKSVNNALKGNKRYELPRIGTLKFVEEKGIEVLQIVMSRQPIPFFDDAIKNTNGELGTAPESIGTSAKKPGIDTSNVTMILPQTGPEPLRARNSIIVPSKGKDSSPAAWKTNRKVKAPVVAVSTGKGESDKLQSGEVAIVEIRLQHN